MKTKVVVLIGYRGCHVFYTDEELEQYLLDNYDITKEDLEDEDRDERLREAEVTIEGGILHDNRAAKVERFLGE